MPLGYLSFNKRNEELFLSKIYVLKESRGKGIGRKAMEFVTSVAKVSKCTKVALTVNRFNQNSIRAYESAGFEKKGELVQDIGNSFVMDDYLMEKII
jgi:ribosomal protein S18 acetylase RimI-like enzyme